MPYAERAGTGRARCRACDETIPKGELRVAFERVFDGPMGQQRGVAYAHPKCLPKYLAHEKERGREAPEMADLLQAVRAHSELEEANLNGMGADAAGREGVSSAPPPGFASRPRRVARSASVSRSPNPSPISRGSVKNRRASWPAHRTTRAI